MFAFNFEIPRGEEILQEDVAGSGTRELSGRADAKNIRDDVRQPCVEVFPAWGRSHRADAGKFLYGPCIGGTQLRYLSPEGLKSSSPEFLELAKECLDLVPGTYEGGFKVWECTWDLNSYLSQGETFDGAVKSIVDLGCGHGLCGIHAALVSESPPSLLVFQDFNSCVLTSVTSENVHANLSAPRFSDTRVKYVAGPWANLPGWLAVAGLLNKFDVVLTSETVYERSTIPDLARAISACLKPGGVAYVAGKIFYFGVGGSPRHLAEALRQLHADFTWEEVQVVESGVKRVVIKATIQ